MITVFKISLGDMLQSDSSVFVFLFLIQMNNLFISLFCCRSGMDWAALMADVLQRLWAQPSWQSVIAGHVSHMVQTLPADFNQLPTIFALFVLAGFPEVSGSRGEQVRVNRALSLPQP